MRKRKHNMKGRRERKGRRGRTGEERGDEKSRRKHEVRGNAYSWDQVIKSIKWRRWNKEANTETWLG